MSSRKKSSLPGIFRIQFIENVRLEHFKGEPILGFFLFVPRPAVIPDYAVDISKQNSRSCWFYGCKTERLSGTGSNVQELFALYSYEIF